ncbi:cation:proton antiporter [Aquabacterium sp. A7-Y]|uniref:cation:proton antiporter n=1 Tax=Aquabacterium sp. A7-Y TaxID=1349605 RepID=UPI00223DD156|nr:cation:proton antiporter [Aquabacterium sp. A7-Y]MCW7536925.1 cation:proton antiporter [Aquabacterium sp. A7-Y]
MSIPFWSLILGLLLVSMVLVGTLLERLPLSSAMVYMGLGWLLGPAVFGLLRPDVNEHVWVLEGLTEAALLISLFSVGLKMGGVTLRDRRWVLPLRLASLSMVLSVALVAAVAMWWLDLSLGAALLLGGILAPTDPVLASGVQTEGGSDPDRLRFSLAGEGGMNDGTAFPFVLLGLGLLGQHELGAWGWRWAVVDLAWATLGGVAIGGLLGALVGGVVVYLRTRHRQAVGLDEFLSVGLVAMSYGAAQLCLASGFLAVFAAGIALRRVRERPMPGTVAVLLSPLPQERTAYEHTATHSHHASATMMDAVLSFTEQLEKLAELVLVLVVGALLSSVVPSLELVLFVPVLLFVIRPVSAWGGTLGAGIGPRPRLLISWFGIRGIGSVYYLLFSIRHGLAGMVEQQLSSLTLMCVAASIVLHGLSAGPLMKRYGTPGSRPPSRG